MKIMLLQINWKTNEVRTSFTEGEDALQRVEAELDLEEKRDVKKEWVRSLFFGRLEDRRPQRSL